MFFIIFFISLFIILLLFLKKYTIAKKTAVFLLFLFAIIISLGKDLGKDYGTYLYNYEINYYAMFFSIKEILWSLLYIIFNFFNIDFFFLVLLVRLMTVLFYYLGLKNLKLNDISMTVAILLYIFVPAVTFINIMRQGLALSIYFYGYSFLKKNDKRKYIFWSFIAFNIQISILLIFIINVLLLYFKKSLKKITSNQILYVFSFIMLSIFVILFINDFFDITFFNNVFSNYTTIFNENTSLKNFISPVVLGNALIIIFVISDEYKKKKNFQDYQIFSYIGVLINCISMISYIFDRVGIIFSFYNPYLISQFVTKDNLLENKRNKCIIFFILLFYCSVFLLNTIVYKEANNLIYKFYF